MSEINFYLKSPNNKKEKSLIYLFFSFNGKRLKYSTQEHIFPTDWNSKSQKARGNNDVNDFLKKLGNDVQFIERQLRTQGNTVTPQLLRKKLDVLYERKIISNHGFYSFIEDYIRKAEDTKKPSTIKGYLNTLKHLKELKNYKNKILDFADINLEFYNEFIDFLTRRKGFATNTIGKQIKNLKVFLNEATERGYVTNQEYKSKKFKVISEEIDSIYLNEFELEHLFNFNLSNNTKFERVRDLFIVGCYSGLRFSDFSAIISENIKEGFIKIKTLKMNRSVVIPIHPFVLEIMNKYKEQYPNSLPPALTNQKMNEYIKIIGKLAGFNDTIQITHTRGIKREAEIFPKWALVTTHTARRSFATNLYLADFPSISIMHITGHSTEKAFLKYIKVTPEQHANKLKQFWEKRSKSF